MNSATQCFDRHAKAAFIIACGALLLSGLAFRGAVHALNIYLKKLPVELRAPLSMVPATLGSWKAAGVDRVFSADVVEALGTDKYIDRTYISEDGGKRFALHFHLAYYTGLIDTVPHVPDRCMVAAGFVDKTLPENLLLPVDMQQWEADSEGTINHASGEVYRVATLRDVFGRAVPVRLPVGELYLRTIRFEHEAYPGQQIFGGYFFIANGRLTPTPDGVKMLAFNPSEKYAYYCKVQYVYAAPDATQEKFLALVGSHVVELLPELMRCLPDWSEIERREAPQVSDTNS